VIEVRKSVVGVPTFNLPLDLIVAAMSVPSGEM
jgi:hypothetical protein